MTNHTNKQSTLTDIAHEVARVWAMDDRYNEAFHRAADAMPHEYLKHALMHVLKAAGKIVCFVDDADHTGASVIDTDIERFVADLVISACKISQTTAIPFDLEAAVRRRLETIETRDNNRRSGAAQPQRGAGPAEPAKPSKTEEALGVLQGDFQTRQGTVFENAKVVAEREKGRPLPPPPIEEVVSTSPTSEGEAAPPPRAARPRPTTMADLKEPAISPDALTQDLGRPPAAPKFGDDWPQAVRQLSAAHRQLVALQDEVLSLLEGDLDRALEAWGHTMSFDLHAMSEGAAKTLCGKARTLTKKLSLGAQIRAHEAFAKERGWNVLKLARDARPELFAVNKLEEILGKQQVYLERKCQEAEEGAA